jgi:putative membrane protein
MSVVLVMMAGAAMPCMMMAQMDPNSNAGSMQGSGLPMNDIERAPGTTPNTSSQGNTQPTSMRDSLGAPGQNGQQILDKQFLRSAAEGSLADVKIGTLATTKGSAEVKTLAQRMVDDHTEMGKELGNVADSMGVQLPKNISKEQQAEYNKLNGLSGKDFDTEYVNYLAKTHWEDVHSFRMESSVAVDQDLQSEVVKALGMMREHIGLIVNTAKDEGITLPRPQRPNPTSASNARH